MTVRDVIIVGASVAGCRAALTLARTGRGVLLLDRCRFPRWKPCAGGVTRKAGPLIPEPLHDLFEQEIRAVRLTCGAAHTTRVRANGILGWTVHRETFDQAHLDLVRSLPGVEVHEGETVLAVVEQPDAVVVATAAGEIRARAVIGADGAGSVVSRAVPGHESRNGAFAYEEEISGTPAGMEDEAVFDFGTIPSGYGWAFPKRARSSIGGYVHRRKAPHIRRELESFCLETRELHNRRTLRARGHLLPIGGSDRRLNSARIVLAGDAGDLVDPLSGEGIYYALRSGVLAGTTVAAFLDGHESLDTYGDRVRAEIQRDLRAAARIAATVFRHPQLAYHLLFRNQVLCGWLAEVLLGRRDYRGLLKDLGKMVWRLPLGVRLGKSPVFRIDVGGE